MEAEIQEKIAGEVVLSPHPGRTMRKWREDFGVSQQDLARQLATVPSVISDYEAERRASPGAAFIRRYVEGLLSFDASHGGKVLQRLGARTHSEGILGMREFRVALPLREFASRIHARPVGRVGLDRDIHGFTLLDALRAILSIDASRFVEFYGWTTQRALLFTNVRYGRSPMVAIRAHPLKPAAVVLLSPGRIDPLAVRLSEVENLPLLTSTLAPETVLERLAEA
ncbi:MAG: transcriptional regulator [Thermoplasmata archaeon]